jgi:hypothetical protein
MTVFIHCLSLHNLVRRLIIVYASFFHSDGFYYFSSLAMSFNMLLRNLKQMAASKPTVKKSRQNHTYARISSHTVKYDNGEELRNGTHAPRYEVLCSISFITSF